MSEELLSALNKTIKGKKIKPEVPPRLFSEQQKIVKEVQKEFADNNDGLTLVVSPRIWEEGSEKYYSCTVEGDCTGCATNFTIPVADFNLERVSTEFGQIARKDWKGLQSSGEEALAFITENNGGELPEGLR